jgi:predicted lipid-binding transport protein (Tim44 family)
MSPINRRFNSSDTISISGIAVAVGIGLLGLLLAYGTYRLQRLFHRRYSQLPIYELEAAPSASDEESSRNGHQHQQVTFSPDESIYADDLAHFPGISGAYNQRPPSREQLPYDQSH